LVTVDSATGDAISNVIRAVQEQNQEKLNAAARSLRVRVGSLTDQAQYMDKNRQNDSVEFLGHVLSRIRSEILQVDIESGYIRHATIVDTEFEIQLVQKKACTE
jgi:hypothetical protein